MELTGVEPASKNRPTFQRLQFSLLLIRPTECQQTCHYRNLSLEVVGKDLETSSFRIRLFTLSIPLGTAVTLSVESEDGDEEVIYSDGFIEDYQ